MRKFILKFFKILFILAVLYIGALVVTYKVAEYKFFKEYGVSTATEESEKIGLVSIYSSAINYPTPSRLTGHSWIYVLNTSDKDITVGGIVVKPNDGISFGTTSHPKMPHKGIWVNVEKFNSNYADNISITDDFYLEDLEYLNIYLENHNKWNLLYNCTTFAAGAWNSINAGQDVEFSAITPKGLTNQISELDDAVLDGTYTINGEMSAFGVGK